MLLVSFLPKMCPQLREARRLADHGCRSHGSDHVDAPASAMWFSKLVESRYIALWTLLLQATRRNRRSKLKPFHLQWLSAALICRNYEFLDASLENSVYTSVSHLWVTVVLLPNEELLPEFRGNSELATAQ